MDIRPIKSDTDYSETLKEIKSLMIAEANSPKA
jgi:HTH-type transcriptional regulator/antitoxin HigA